MLFWPQHLVGLGHRAGAVLEELVELSQPALVQAQLDAHDGGEGLAREVVFGRADAAGNDKQQIRALYAKLKNAMVSKNAAAIEKMEAPGFTQTEQGRTMDAAQANAMMKQEFAMVKKTKRMNLDISQITIKGKNAHVKTKYLMEAIIAGPDKKNHTMKVTGGTEDTLVKSAKGWLFLKEKDTGSKALVDGKPMQGM